MPLGLQVSIQVLLSLDSAMHMKSSENGSTASLHVRATALQCEGKNVLPMKALGQYIPYVREVLNLFAASSTVAAEAL